MANPIPSADDLLHNAQLARMTPEQRAAYWQLGDDAVTSDANRRLKRIAAKLEDARREIASWLDDHGDGCDCAFCQFTPYIADYTDDLQGVRWAAQTGVSIIKGITLGNGRSR